MNDPVIKVTGRTLQLSESVRRLNPDLGRVRAEEPQQKAPAALEQEQRGQIRRKRGVAGGGPVLRVTLISFRGRALDGDNLQGGFKPLRDAIASWLGLDDRDDVIAWEYGQVETRGAQGTAVKIEAI